LIAAKGFVLKEKLYVFEGDMQGICVWIQMEQGRLKKVDLSLQSESGLSVKISGTDEDLDSPQATKALRWLKSYQEKKPNPSLASEILLGAKLTSLEKKVLNQMAKIPFGCVCTYGELGRVLGSENYARFIGSTCRKNPFPLFVPCHRIVKVGGIGEFTPGVKIKEILLSHENAPSPSLARA
jgi:O-6-methylguanine DNA methyltransferase